MIDRKKLKGLFYKQVIVIINAWVIISFFSDIFAATLQIGKQSFVVMAGQTIEVPLYSSKPMAGDLKAKGHFQSGDVTFTPSPNCHLSSQGCTLLISAAYDSKNYRSVPVVVSESGTSDKPVFVLSVIQPGEADQVNTKLPEIISKPLMLTDEVGSVITFAFTNTSKSTLHNIQAWQLPMGISSSICATVEPGAICHLKLVVNDITETGDNVISINSDNGIIQHRVLSIMAPKLVIQKSDEILPSKPIVVLTSGNLSATIIPHSLSTLYYTASSNGPVYQMILVTNNGGSVTLDTPSISGTDAAAFSIDTNSSDYQGSPKFCNDAPTLANGDSCEIIIKSTLGDPTSASLTALLTISNGVSGDTLMFDLTDTTYVYAGGGFDTLGNANVSGGNLLAQCTAGRCTNALRGTTGDNYASTNFSVGKWINALRVTPTGNLMVGGVFGGIGGATSGASSGTAALLAQCIPGASVIDNACFNQITTGNTYVLNNAYIDAITSPFAISTNNYIALGGDFNQIKNISAASSGRLLAKCEYKGVAAVSNCSTYIGTGTSSVSRYANNAIAALSTFGSTSSAAKLNVGGLFTQIAGYPSSAPSVGTTFATCTSVACSQGMSTNNPNNSILGMSDDGATYIYMGGTFTQIGGYTDTSGGYPLVRCVTATVTSCDNALSGSNDANGYIEGLAYSGGNLYVGGNFTTIGGATPVSGGNMLAVCTPGGGCSNFVTNTNPYATGTDWGGGIFAIAVGNQTTIAPH